MTNKGLTAFSISLTNSMFIAIQVISFLINAERSEST